MASPNTKFFLFITTFGDAVSFEGFLITRGSGSKQFQIKYIHKNVWILHIHFEKFRRYLLVQQIRTS